MKKRYSADGSPFYNKYLNQLFAEGDLLEQLKNYMDEFSGPGGQGSTLQAANNIRKDMLKRAIAVVEAVAEENPEKAIEAYKQHGKSTIK